MTLPPHKTKIVCTIGPSSDSQEIIEQMLLSGMNVARLNFSHGDFSYHRQVIGNLRTAARVTGCRLTIMADLPGPKIRIGQIASEPLDLRPGDRLVLTIDDTETDPERISVNFPGILHAVNAGDTLFLNDGLIQLIVESVKDTNIYCRIIVGGELRSRKGLNLPGIDLGISAFTTRDFECLKFALEHEIDAVSQSFVSCAADIRAVRQAAASLGHSPFIVAKIERSNALEHLDDIIEEADGIMIARGDLGVEVPIEQVPVIQKRLMNLASKAGKPVITATQMLESMIHNRRPTRAEATDVANAILDGTDCVMLSGESAMGSYPVEAVAMLAKIASSIEPLRTMVKVSELFPGSENRGVIRPAHLIAMSVETSIEYVTPAAVFVPTRSGTTARRIAQFRLPSWIVAVSSQEATCQRLQFSSGVWPVHKPEHPEDWKTFVKDWVSNNGLTGNLVILTEGPSSKHPGANHRMEVIDLSST